MTEVVKGDTLLVTGKVRCGVSRPGRAIAKCAGISEQIAAGGTAAAGQQNGK